MPPDQKTVSQKPRACLQVLQCNTEQKALSEALQALEPAPQTPAVQSKSVWVTRPGGVIISLSREQARSAVRQGMRPLDCTE